MHSFFRTRRALLAACFLFFAGTGEMLLHAQLLPVPTEVQSPDYGYTVLMDLDRLQAEEGPDAAIDALASVHPSDTLYEKVLLQHVSLLLDHRPDDHDAQVALLKAGIALNGWDAYTFYISLPAVLASQERGQEALEAAEEAMRRYPMNAQAARTKSIALMVLERKDEALALLQDLARQFPFEASIHADIAEHVSADGEYTRAAMAYAYALGLEMETSNSQEVLVNMDNLLRGASPDYEENGFDFGSSAGRYADLDLLVKNRVSMDKKYKMKPKVSFAFARQFHFICSNLEQLPKQDGFWYDMYESVFRDFLDDDLFEGWLYMALASSPDPDVYQQAVKNKKKLLAFRDQFRSMIFERYGETEAEFDGKMLTVERAFKGNGEILGLGKTNNNDEAIGPWRFYHTNGVVAVSGRFNDRGEEEGRWSYYDLRGVLRREEYKTAGSLNGPYLLYSPNGRLSDSLYMVDGQPEGSMLSYSINGAPELMKTAKGGVKTGPAKEFHPNGAVQYAYQLVDDLPEGSFEGYYPDGTKSLSVAFKDGNLHGQRLEFWASGDTTSIEQYQDGELHGPYARYWDGFGLKSKGQTIDGMVVDTAWEYYIHGGLSYRPVFDSKGKQDGEALSYASTGRLFSRMEYKRDLLVAYTFYNSDGSILAQQERKKGGFDYVGYSEFGKKQVEGRYLDEGDKDGTWTYYYDNGTVRSVESMDKGQLNGPLTSYYPNGQIEDQRTYSEDLMEGVQSSFYPDGALAGKGVFAEGEYNGSSISYYPDGTTPKSIYYYIDGTKEGYQYTYDPDGRLEKRNLLQSGFLVEECLFDTLGRQYDCLQLPEGKATLELHYANGATYARFPYHYGVKEGSTQWFFPDGSVEYEGRHLNGNLEGEWVQYHENGRVYSRASYRMGEIQDSMRYYYKNGKLESVMPYFRGVQHGLYRSYHRNGQPDLMQETAFGEAHGTTTTYAYTGERQMVRYYHRGRLIGYSYEGRDGQLVDTIFVDQTSVLLEPRYRNGQLSRSMPLENGLLHGEYREYYPSGQLMESATYFYDQRHGKYRKYFPDGSIRQDGEYHYGQPIGVHLVYQAPGVLLRKTPYVNGELHGIRTVYASDGSVEARYRYRNSDLVEFLEP